MAFALSYDRRPVRVVGPFATQDAANAWAEKNKEGVWATSTPTPCPSPDDLSWQVWGIGEGMKAIADLYKDVVALEKEKDERK